MRTYVVALFKVLRRCLPRASYEANTVAKLSHGNEALSRSIRTGKWEAAGTSFGVLIFAACPSIGDTLSICIGTFGAELFGGQSAPARPGSDIGQKIEANPLRPDSVKTGRTRRRSVPTSVAEPANALLVSCGVRYFYGC